MRIAAIYDIHGNLPALEAVIADARAAGAEEVVVGGDVLPGPMPREVIDCLAGLDLPVRYLAGNGDRETLALARGIETGTVPPAFRVSMRWVADQLSPGDQERIAGWPATLTVSIHGVGDVLFCHATPRNDTEIFTVRTPDAPLLPVFGGLAAAVVVCGHTHMQFDRRVGRTRVINAGSVGMPFGGPGAYWLLIGPGIELRHTAYDLEAAAVRIRRTAYPQASEFADGNVLRPPSAEQVLDRLTKAELR
jgi:predicted phosphodiesterase